MIRICTPAFIYLIFSLVQIVIDVFRGYYNVAGIKVAVMCIVTWLLNLLCASDMGIISWIIVALPFIFMSTIVAVLIGTFGLRPDTGTMTGGATEVTYTKYV